MPRQSRIDAPGALHHVIARGIAQKRIFLDDTDRNRFVDRLGGLLRETETRCFAWSLIPNHFHLLLRTGSIPIASVMRRLLTGYAITHNQRHGRWGHLFQNRYKSILCQEEPYLLELVRYIHLNPLRAKLVRHLKGLDSYRYGGHSVVLGNRGNDWQDTEYVLVFFGKRTASARRKYRAFVEKGIADGKRGDLVGGGLIRSMGGWSTVKGLRKAKEYLKGDERILGDSEFVDKVLSQADEVLEQKCRLKSSGLDVDKIAEGVAELMEMKLDKVWSAGKYRRVVNARSLLCYWAVRELGLSMASLSRRLDTPAAIGQSVLRGERLARENGYALLEK